MFSASARRSAAAGALTLALGGLAAQPASAGSDERIDVKYGYATFRSDGDRLAAGDIWADGRGVRARLTWVRRGKTKRASVLDGSAGYESARHLSIREGTTVYLQLCYTNDGKDLNCTRAQKAEA
jgi:hypothetical protein